jgi:hypothetical protein
MPGGEALYVVARHLNEAEANVARRGMVARLFRF